jgi:hypothetical protein
VAHRCASVALAAFSMILPRPATPVTSCPTTVDNSDPLVVAGAVATWIYCGPPPAAATTLSSHGRRVLTNWSSANAPSTPSAVVALNFVDPRSAPVVVYAVVRRAGDAEYHRVILTLFHRPSGGWAVDDLTVLSG